MKASSMPRNLVKVRSLGNLRESLQSDQKKKNKIIFFAISLAQIPILVLTHWLATHKYDRPADFFHYQQADCIILLWI
jgi:hypothetical protein